VLPLADFMAAGYDAQAAAEVINSMAGTNTACPIVRGRNFSGNHQLDVGIDGDLVLKHHLDDWLAPIVRLKYRPNDPLIDLTPHNFLFLRLWRKTDPASNPVGIGTDN
jgi:hypothetical protein